MGLRSPTPCRPVRERGSSLATFLPLPPIQVQAIKDQSGFNTGNWTTSFNSSVLQGLNVPVFELYHMVVQSAPAGASAVLGFSPGLSWGFTAPGVGQGSEYHLSGSGWILRPSTEFYLFWTAAATGVPPLVTAWFRFDIDVPVNRRTATGLAFL